MLGSLADVAFQLTVAGSLEPLADTLAEVLAHPLPDPFTREVVVVPGDGVRSWLVARLARRLGATAVGSDGIAANLDFTFPADLVGRVLGQDAGLGSWAVGPLTWAVHHVLQEQGSELGQSADPVRARAIADLFDRYTLYRPDMVVRWSEGVDVGSGGQALAPHHRWQPALWRALRSHLGAASDAERTRELVAALRAGSVPAEVPDRVVVFGLASLPPPHLQVLAALAGHREVHVLAPVASAERWADVRAQLHLPLRLPVSRTREAEVDVPVGRGHDLVTTWGRTSREANVLLLDAAAGAAETTIRAPDPVSSLPEHPTVLARLQHGLRADESPVGPPRDSGEGVLFHPDPRPLLAPDDASIRWHRAYGPARQVEVLRDALLHLFEESDEHGAPLVEPRHVAVLCPDVARFAPLIDAAFAGDPDHGVPAIPVRVADRSLRQDNPLLDAAGALLDLLDGRFRASSVLAFAARPPVRHRFGLDTSALARIGEWAEATNVRWGLGPADRERFGIPSEVDVHTWMAGLDQLLVGATMAAAGPRLAPGDVVPFGEVEGDDVEVAGALAELVHHLERAMAALRTPAPVDRWCRALTEAIAALCSVSDADSWQWRQVERTIEDLRAEATLDGEPRSTIVDPLDLAVLVRARLAGSPGRARFGSGAVTVSSLTAQRGVPHPVVCLLGLDADVGAGAIAGADDLVALEPCVGDRDARSEQRAQLLDAVLAAGERLLVFSTGHDVRTNAEVPPVVALAELFDVVDALVRVPEDARGRVVAARELLAVDHPRQAWSERNLVPDELGYSPAWTFDRGALAAAEARRSQGLPSLFLPEPLAPPAPSEEGPARVPLSELLDACANPVQLLLRRRLQVSVPDEDDPVDDQIPLDLAGLERWRVADALLAVRLGPGAVDLVPPDGDEASGPAGPAGPGVADEARWEQVERRRGAVPPLAFGDAAIDGARTLVAALVAELEGELCGDPYAPDPVDVEVEVAGPAGPVVVEGTVPDLCGDLLLTVSASSLKPKDRLRAWVQLAALTVQHPERAWRAAVIGRGRSWTEADVVRIGIASPEAAAEVLAVVVDLHRRAMCDAVPAPPTTTCALHEKGLGGARSVWERPFSDGTDRWLTTAFGRDFDDLLALPVRADERLDGRPAPSRLAYWTDRVWGTYDRTTVAVPGGIPGSSAEVGA